MMRNDTCRFSSSRRSLFSIVLAAAFLVGLLLPGSGAYAQLSDQGDVNTSKMPNYQNECSIIKNPTPGSQQLFAACNNSTGGLFAARSTNHGATWIYPDADKTLADGDPGQGPLACCDPTLAWDTFGNLYFAYLGNNGASVVVLLSTNGGASFTTLVTFAGSLDQPTIVAANTSAAGAPVAVWLVWNQSGSMRASGAAVTGLGAVGAFGPVQTIPGTSNCSFGDVAISPAGVVVQTCQTPTGGQGPGTILVNRDLDGLGAGGFGPAITATTTNVGGFDFIPAQNVRSIDSEAGLAYDHFPGGMTPNPRFGRLYLVYTEETVNENHNTQIMLRFSDDDGATWSVPQTVNTDATTRSQFLPRIASNRLSGNIAVCWHDARNSGTNTSMQEFCDIATPAVSPPVFIGNHEVGDVLTAGNGSNPPVAGQANIQFGDYSGMTYFQGRVHPIWADHSNSTGDNPDGTSRFDAYTDLVMGGPAANEGDPHIRTVDGVHYDFQGGGEYTVLLDSDGSEIQARHTPIATSFVVGPNGHTGLSTCTSLTTAVAARVGDHRVTYQPNLSGVPDPTGLQLRIDGVLTVLGPGGLNLGGGARVSKTSAPGGIEVQFPNGTHMAVTPGWWSSQSKWYLNINVSRTSALEGIMGDVQDGWLPRLPNGTTLGPKPATLPSRYTDLYQTFGNAWRVTTASSLFDYASGTSTHTFTYPTWPPDKAPCTVPEQKPIEVLFDQKKAEVYCEKVRDENRRANCVFDVMVTHDEGFAKTYELTELFLNGGTVTTLTPEVDVTAEGKPTTFTVVVDRVVPVRGGAAPAGTVHFFIDGREAGRAELDRQGQLTWTAMMERGDHTVSATFTPDERSGLLPSDSGEVRHTVGTTASEGEVTTSGSASH
jgi:hypothetical protein